MKRNCTSMRERISRKEFRRSILETRRRETIIDAKGSLPDTYFRIVSDANQKWFEFGFDCPVKLNGDAINGWIDEDFLVHLLAEYSEDLVHWSTARFRNAPVPRENVTGGYRYWSRAIQPVDAMVKTGAIVCESNSSDGDSRNNPITSVVIAGTILSLPRYPYTFPGDAANLQADIIAAGFPGTIVQATSDIQWSISIPSVNYTTYAQSSYVKWPGYLVADMFGQMTNTIDRRTFIGAFVNSTGDRVTQKAFARIRLSTLKK